MCAVLHKMMLTCSVVPTMHELLRGFEQRGFYLDNQSAQTLVAFYERMGNVERMSDSGDAVYVRKTV